MSVSARLKSRRPSGACTFGGMAHRGTAREDHDQPVHVVSLSGMLAAAVAAGLGAIGWSVHPVTVGRARHPPERDEFPSRVVVVADEQDVLPELGALGECSVVAVTSWAAARSLLAVVEFGALAVDADQPLHALLRELDHALAGTGCVPGRRLTVESARAAVKRADRVAGLTAREREVLDLLMVGRAADEIACHLVVSLPTVRTHIRSILHKLGVSSQLAAAAIARASGGGPGMPNGRIHQF